MPKLDLWGLSSMYQNQWIVLDRSWNVVDHGSCLEELKEKHAALAGSHSFYFVPGS